MQVEISLAQVEGRHKPVQSGRRGEIFAWFSAIGVGLGTALLAWRTGEVSGLTVGATLMLFMLASIISFGNWVDRNKIIEVTEEVVHYQSPLRQLDLNWDRIQQLKLLPSNQGWRIHVIGLEGSFQFQSRGRLSFGGFEEMEVGFPAGVNIAAYLCRRSGLTAINHRNMEWIYRRPEAIVA